MWCMIKKREAVKLLQELSDPSSRNPLLKLPRLSIVLFLSFAICLRDTGGLEDFSVPDLAPAYYIIQNGYNFKLSKFILGSMRLREIKQKK